MITVVDKGKGGLVYTNLNYTFMYYYFSLSFTVIFSKNTSILACLTT